MLEEFKDMIKAKKARKIGRDSKKKKLQNKRHFIMVYWLFSKYLHSHKNINSITKNKT